MAGVLAAEHRTGVGHHLLDVRVTHACRTGMPPSSRTISGTAFEQIRLCTTVRSASDAPSATRSRIERADERGGQRSRERLRVVVDEEDAVGVAVEREPDVGLRVEDRALEVLEVLGLDRVGGVVGERAVELAEDHGELGRESREHRGDHEAADAVGRVGDDAQRREGVDVDERADVRDELREQVHALRRGRSPRPARAARRPPWP